MSFIGTAIVQLVERGKIKLEPLGDFSMKQGRREQASNAYKKALDVDSNFEHAKEMLKKLMQ